MIALSILRFIYVIIYIHSITNYLIVENRYPRTTRGDKCHYITPLRVKLLTYTLMLYYL